MNVDQGSLTAVFTGLKAIFTEALAKVEPGAVDDLMATVPSLSDTEVYPVAALLGDLEEVLDEVTMTNIGRFIQSVPNRTFARIVQVRRNDIADDHIGLYTPAVQGLARRAAQYPLRLAAEALQGGFATPWTPDGAMVFSAAHVWVGGQAWSNLAAPVALGVVSFNAACLALALRAGPDRVPLGLNPTHLVIGPANQAAAELIVETEKVGGTNNVNYKRAKIVMLPRFGTSMNWFVCDASGMRPMVLQDREGPEFVADEETKSHVAFYQEKYAYKARRRCAVATLAPWLIQANVGA